MEMTFENKKIITIYTLSLKRGMESDIGNAYRAPCEDGGDGEFLEPAEDESRSTTSETIM
jgi:hypothetical protein